MARGFRGSSRMAKRWDFLPGLLIGMTASGNQGGSTLGIVDQPYTVLRMLGEYVIAPTGNLTAGDRCSVGIGIGVVSADAATLGATALPDPEGEPEYPWLYWASHDFYFPAGGTPLQPAGPSESVRVTFDVKSMRKVKPREVLAYVVDYTDGSGTPPLTLASGPIRVLKAS